MALKLSLSIWPSNIMSVCNSLRFPQTVGFIHVTWLITYQHYKKVQTFPAERFCGQYIYAKQTDCKYLLSKNVVQRVIETNSYITSLCLRYLKIPSC